MLPDQKAFQNTLEEFVHIAKRSLRVYIVPQKKSNLLPKKQTISLNYIIFVWCYQKMTVKLPRKTKHPKNHLSKKSFLHFPNPGPPPFKAAMAGVTPMPPQMKTRCAPRKALAVRYSPLGSSRGLNSPTHNETETTNRPLDRVESRSGHVFLQTQTVTFSTGKSPSSMGKKQRNKEGD